MRPKRLFWALGLGLCLGLSLPLAHAGSGKCAKGDKKCSEKERDKAPTMGAGAKASGVAPMPRPTMKARATAGVSVGGAQDIGYARKQIASGNVPNAKSFTPEGLFSEHDFEMPEGSCEKLFCLRPDAAEVKILSERDPWILIQLGLDSGVDLASFRRQPQNLVVVLDRSGSMSGAKISAARAALSKLVDLMTSDDRLGVVLFDDRVDVLYESTRMTASAKAELKKLIGTIAARGSTDIDSGLRRGFEMVAANMGQKGVSDRVLLFTDALPNVGPTSEKHFAGMTKKYGEQGIGLTIFGVGIDFGYAIAETTSAVRGANYVFLQDAEKLEKVFDEDFDFLVTPIAYDFKLELEAGPGYALGEVFGIPGAKDKKNAAQLKVETLFLSKEKGAIAVRVKKEDLKKAGNEVAYLSLSYTPVGSQKAVYETATVKLSQEAGPGVRKLAALVSMARTMEEACEGYFQGKKDLAAEILPPLATLLREEAKILGDNTLKKEAELVEKLEQNISRKPSPYNGGYIDPWDY